MAKDKQGEHRVSHLRGTVVATTEVGSHVGDLAGTWYAVAFVDGFQCWVPAGQFLLDEEE
jgi:hypothetical protein